MNIAIIGCGYVGLEAAQIWAQKGYHVTATTDSPERLSELSKIAQKSLILKGNDEEQLVPLIAQNDLILITLSSDSPEYYNNANLHTAQTFRHLALEMDLPRDLIYASSTAIYGDHHGLWVDETSDLLAKNEAAKILIDAEKIYASLEELGWSICILRLAEVYGPTKELSKRVSQLEGHALPVSGNQYTNMVHRTDCAHAFDYALRHHLEGIFNLADDEHQTRKELYDQISKKFALPKVKWDASLPVLHMGNKRVSNHKIKAEGFSLRHVHRVLD